MAPRLARKDKSTSVAPAEQAAQAPSPVAMLSPQEQELRTRRMPRLHEEGIEFHRLPVLPDKRN